MPDIDPEEDELVQRMIEEAAKIAERNLLRRGMPMDTHQLVNKAIMELRLMYDEILQIDKKKRTRSDIEKAYRAYLERMDSTAQNDEKEIREQADAICRMLLHSQ